MAATLDRAVFFAAVRKRPFPNALSQGQVSGMESILDACPPDLGSDPLAYCLATAFLETARTMLPIKEYGGEAYFKKMYDPQGARPDKAKELGNTVPGDGAKFAGRGYVQLTGRANYRRATGELQNRGYLTRDQDLTQTPDMAMVPDIAAAIMFLGMQAGWFTGKKLSGYFGGGRLADAYNARRIINGTDRAAEIADYFAGFQVALKAAGHAPGREAPSVPTPPVDTKPLDAPPLVAPAPRRTSVPVAGNDDRPAPKPSVGTRIASWLTKVWTG